MAKDKKPFILEIPPHYFEVLGWNTKTPLILIIYGDELRIMAKKD